MEISFLLDFLLHAKSFFHRCLGWHQILSLRYFIFEPFFLKGHALFLLLLLFLFSFLLFHHHRTAAFRPFIEQLYFPLLNRTVLSEIIAWTKYRDFVFAIIAARLLTFLRSFGTVKVLSAVMYLLHF